MLCAMDDIGADVFEHVVRRAIADVADPTELAAAAKVMEAADVAAMDDQGLVDHLIGLELLACRARRAKAVAVIIAERRRGEGSRASALRSAS
jgi:hypothetical protein